METVQKKLLDNITKEGEFELMPNGEKRYRIQVNDKLIYSATVSEKECGWQNAHYHTDAKETYFLKKGRMLIAIKEKGKIVLRKVLPGKTIDIEPYIEHNVFVGDNTIFYVKKESKKSLLNDWHSAVELDSYSKCLVN